MLLNQWPGAKNTHQDIFMCSLIFENIFLLILFRNLKYIKVPNYCKWHCIWYNLEHFFMLNQWVSIDQIQPKNILQSLQCIFGRNSRLITARGCVTRFSLVETTMIWGLQVFYVCLKVPIVENKHWFWASYTNYELSWSATKKIYNFDSLKLIIFNLVVLGTFTLYILIPQNALLLQIEQNFIAD